MGALIIKISLSAIYLLSSKLNHVALSRNQAEYIQTDFHQIITGKKLFR